MILSRKHISRVVRIEVLFFSTVISLFSCREIPPVITGAVPSIEIPSNVKEQKKQVLIEEFTGVRCVNCPAGSAAIEELRNIHGNQLVAVSIHAGDFAPPYAQSKYDFRTAEGNQLLSFLEIPFSYPTAIINRKKFDGKFGLQLGMGDWAGFISTEKMIDPTVKIDIKSNFTPVTRKLEMTIILYFQENLTASSVNLSVMIAENNIVDLQLTPGSSTPKADYVHKHVLRKMLTKFDGDALSMPIKTQEKVEKNYQFTLPGDWKEKDCKVIAFVNLGGNEKTVLQAHEMKIVE